MPNFKTVFLFLFVFTFLFQNGFAQRDIPPKPSEQTSVYDEADVLSPAEEQQLERKPFPLPQLNLTRKPESIFHYQYEDFEIVNYQAHPSIKAPIAV